MNKKLLIVFSLLLMLISVSYVIFNKQQDNVKNNIITIDTVTTTTSIQNNEENKEEQDLINHIDSMNNLSNIEKYNNVIIALKEWDTLCNNPHEFDPKKEERLDTDDDWKKVSFFMMTDYSKGDYKVEDWYKMESDNWNTYYDCSGYPNKDWQSEGAADGFGGGATFVYSKRLNVYCDLYYSSNSWRIDLCKEGELEKENCPEGEKEYSYSGIRCGFVIKK